MPFADYMPPIVVGYCPEGHAEMLKMVNEEPILWGKVYECHDFAYAQSMIYTDDDYLRPKHLPVCTNRSRAGVRDMNLCCRCMQGLPGTFQHKQSEEMRDAAISL